MGMPVGDYLDHVHEMGRPVHHGWHHSLGGGILNYVRVKKSSRALHVCTNSLLSVSDRGYNMTSCFKYLPP